MNFQTVGAVFKVIVVGVSIKRQFSWLANRHKAYPKRQCEGRTKNEPTCLCRNDRVELRVFELICQLVNGGLERLRARKQRRDVTK